MSRRHLSLGPSTWFTAFLTLSLVACGATSSPDAEEQTEADDDEPNKPNKPNKPTDEADAGDDEPGDDEPADDEPADDEPSDSTDPDVEPATPAVPPATPDGECDDGEEGCPCYPNATCNDALTCLSSLCVNLETPATPQPPASPGTPPTPDTPTPPTPPAVPPTPPAVPDTPPAVPDTPPTPPTPPPVNPSSDIIDNFATCDDYINEVDGRSGSWYSWADNGINLDFAVRTPPSGWSNQGCAALATGGELPSGETNFAGIGLIVANGEPYDLRGYSGLTVSIETGDDVSVAIKTLSGGQFGYRLGPTTGSETTNIDFYYFGAWANSTSQYLDLSEVIEIQFVPHSLPFGFAVHLVSLY